MVAQYLANVTFGSTIPRIRRTFCEANVPLVASLVVPLLTPVKTPVLRCKEIFKPRTNARRLVHHDRDFRGAIESDQEVLVAVLEVLNARSRARLHVCMIA